MRRLCWLAFALGATAATAQTIHGKDGITLPPPPKVAVQPVVDSYKVAGGPDVQITDNYRYLEDAHAAETRAFITAENAYTEQYLTQVKMLPEVRTKVSALLRTDEMSTPIKRGGRFFFTRRMRTRRPSFCAKDCTARTSS